MRYALIRVKCFGDFGCPYEDEVVSHFDNMQDLIGYCKENRFRLNDPSGWNEYFVETLTTKRITQLDELVGSKTISAWKIENINENGEVGISQYRNTQRLTLTFCNGEVLVIDTICSGRSGNTEFC